MSDNPWMNQPNPGPYPSEVVPLSVTAYADPVAHAEVTRLRAENESLWADLDKYDLQAWEDMEDRVKKAEAENERLRAKVARVVALHHASDDGCWCVGCWEAGGFDGAPMWPCPTIKVFADPEVDE